MQPPPIAVGSTCLLRLADGLQLEGELRAVHDGWFELASERGPVWVQAAHVAVVAAGGAKLPVVGKPARAGGAAKSPRPAAPAWTDDELRLLANAFLDGVVDRDLAQEFGRSPGELRLLRQAYACVRGDVDEDQVPATAASWVPRLRRVLAG